MLEQTMNLPASYTSTKEENMIISSSLREDDNIENLKLDSNFRRKLVIDPPAMASTPHTSEQVLRLADDHTSRLRTPAPPYEPSPVSQSSSVGDTLTGNRPEAKAKVDPKERFKVEKLMVALRDIGIDPSTSQQAELLTRLHPTDNGFVTYGKFAAVAKEVFKLELDVAGRGKHDTTDLTVLSSPSVNQTDSPSELDPSVLLRMRTEQELAELRAQNASLQEQLQQERGALQRAEAELCRLRAAAQLSVTDQRAQSSREQLAARAQQAARSTEQEYEAVVRGLEEEAARLRAQVRAGGADSGARDKRLQVLEAEYSKAMSHRKTYEVATNRLLDFAEYVHDSLTHGVSRGPAAGSAARDGQPPRYLAAHRAAGSRGLAEEARRTVRAVRTLLETEPLPFGWSQAFNSDGVKYYVNHVTQQTSWYHPVSRMGELQAQ